MCTALSAIALLVVAASSVAADSQSYLPVTHVRSLGMKAIKKARSKVLAGRRMAESGDDIDMSGIDMSGIDMGDFANVTFTGEDMNQMVPMICMLFESGMLGDDVEDDFEKDIETEGMVCSNFGCDDPNAATPNLVMNCTMDGEYCEDDDGEQFCITNNEIQMSMGLDFVGTSQIKSTQCSTYTKPDYMAAMGHGCWKIDASMNFGDMMEASMSVEMGTMTEEEAAKMSAEYIQITECSAEFFGDGTKCECGTCNDGMGFELTCNNDLVSQECTDFDTSVVDASAISEGGASSPEIAVMKLVATPDAGNVVKETDVSDADTTDVSDADTGTATKAGETSPAASRTEAMASGLVFAFASFLALM